MLGIVYKIKGKFWWLLVAVILAILAGAGIARLYWNLNDGFFISHITSDEPYQGEWEIRPLTDLEQHELEAALDQPYTYLAKGHQAYVFESQDQRYVIKFLKFQKLRLPALLTKTSLPFPPLEHYRQTKLQERRKRLEEIFNSWKIAFEELKNETGLVYVHLNQSHHLNKKLIITDKIGVGHVIDLDEVVFLVQKKGDVIADVITNYMAQHNMISAEKVLDDLIDFYIAENKRGFAEDDRHIARNAGLLNGKVIHIDIGRFIKDDSYAKPSVYQEAMIYKSEYFRKWLNKHYPELLPYFEMKLNHLTD